MDRLKTEKLKTLFLLMLQGSTVTLSKKGKESLKEYLDDDDNKELNGEWFIQNIDCDGKVSICGEYHTMFDGEDIDIIEI